MNFQDAVRVCLMKYSDFNGRASRPEMWFGLLAAAGVSMLASIVDSVAFDIALDDFGVFYAIAFLGLLLPTLAAQVRRLHDTDRSGWWVLIALLPLVGLILLIVWWSQKGTVGTNRFGPEPHLAADRIEPVAGSTSRASPAGDLERLERLHSLHESGALTAEEFAAEKAKLLQL